VDYRLKKMLLTTEMDFWRRATTISKISEVRNEVITDKMGVTLTMLGPMKRSMLKLYENTFHMEDNRWPKQIPT
jgi:hypothetical protein